MPGPLSIRLVEVVLRCYPARWRNRHGDEAAELAALLMRDGMPARSIAWSFLRGAARERLTPRPSRRFGVAVGTLLVATGSLGVPLALVLSSAPASAASTVRVSITSPGKAAAQLESVFRSHHFDVAVTQEPVSPSLVGSIVKSSLLGPRTSEHNILSGITGPCPGGAQGCITGIVLPSHFTGIARLVVGRPAKAGEAYAAAADIFRPGEMLHCSGLLGETTEQALPILVRRHVKIVWNTGREGADGRSVPGGLSYVAGGDALSATAISIRVTAEEPAAHNFAGSDGQRC
jgi:hypothetical protein